MLERFYNGNCIEVPETNALRRKILISDEQITKKGTEYYESLLENKEVQKEDITKKEIDEAFDKWWGVRGTEGIYPNTDYFKHKGRVFQGTQKKNIKKPECKSLFRKLVLSGDYTINDILQGTENHIDNAKENSIKKGSNQLSFIPNSQRYLREECFQPFIKQNKKQDEYKGATAI